VAESDSPAPARPPRPRSATGVVGTSVTATVLAVLAPCLLGALGVVVRRDLEFDAAQLGIAVGAFYAVSALVAFLSGRFALAEFLGVRRSIFLGVSIVTFSLLMVAFLARNWVDLAIAMGISGLANGLTQPAANLALAQRVPARRMGLAFGVKQAAVPGATLLAGLSVGGLALLGDWRTAFWLGGGLCLAFLIAALVTGPRLRIPARGRLARKERQRLTIDAPLVRITLGASISSIGVNAMRVFFVEAAVDKGEQLAVAGFVLAAASLAGILTRLFGGWRSDAVPRNPFLSAATLIFAGSVGYFMMAFVQGTFWLIVAAVLGIAAGWGWSGLVQLGVVRSYQEAPGAASAFIHFGTLTGSLIGPIVFGFLLSLGFFTSWIVVATISALGALLLLVSTRRPLHPH
jgi:MFS family permease